LSAFVALARLKSVWAQQSAQLLRRVLEAEAELKASVHLRAAKLVESAWRSRYTLPACPHCGEGIAATDGLGQSRVNKPIDAARRKARKTPRAKPALGSSERDGAKAPE
jgi:hypothetical protein